VQDAPANTEAKLLYTNVAAREYKARRPITHAANKASEVNAFNIPYTPAMIIRVYPSLKQPLQTFRLLSAPIKMLTGSSNGTV
jgi:hypothetical protein